MPLAVVAAGGLIQPLRARRSGTLRAPEATTDWDEITELVTDSYRLTAPKKLIAQLDAEDAH